MRRTIAFNNGTTAFRLTLQAVQLLPGDDIMSPRSRSLDLRCPADRFDSQYAWHLYLLRLNLQCLRCSRNQFLPKRHARGIGATVRSPLLYMQATYAAFGHQSEICQVATQEYAREISRRICRHMIDEDLQRVVDAVEGNVKRFLPIPNLPS